MRIITLAIFLTLLATTVFAADLTPNGTGATTTTTTGQYATILSQIQALNTKIDSVQQNSMTANDFHTLAAEMQSNQENSALILLSKLLILLIVFEFAKIAFEIILKIKKVIP